LHRLQFDGNRRSDARPDSAENKQVKKLIAAFSVRPGIKTATEDQIVAGEMEVELVPQGTLVERCRAGGAGIRLSTRRPAPGPSSRKEGKSANSTASPCPRTLRSYLDYALVRAYRADTRRQSPVRGGSQNLNPSFAKAARIAIVEVDEIVEVGEIRRSLITLPGIFVSRVRKEHAPARYREVAHAVRRRPADKPRLYNGKPGLTRAAIAKRAAGLVNDNSYVNLGVGIPTMVSNYLENRDVTLHAENGVLGYGEMLEGDDVDLDNYNAAGQFVALRPGASFFDSVTSFEMAAAAGSIP
jgi:3-oxoacid CoA-transferase